MASWLAGAVDQLLLARRTGAVNAGGLSGLCGGRLTWQRPAKRLRCGCCQEQRQQSKHTQLHVERCSLRSAKAANKRGRKNAMKPPRDLARLPGCLHSLNEGPRDWNCPPSLKRVSNCSPSCVELHAACAPVGPGMEF
jgi:hypothetical protein